MAFATSTMLAISAGVAIAGAGLSAYGQMQQAKTAQKIGEYNAKLDENQALQAELDSRENIRRKRAESKKFMGMARAKYAKAGVLEEGSPLEVLSETAGLLELDALEQGRKTANEANQLRARAKIDRATGAAGMSAAKIGAGATLLSGASQAAGSYYGRT